MIKHLASDPGEGAIIDTNHFSFSVLTLRICEITLNRCCYICTFHLAYELFTTQPSHLLTLHIPLSYSPFRCILILLLTYMYRTFLILALSPLLQ
jgi:hypothetical protein